MPSTTIPMRQTLAGCWARAPSGQAAAAPPRRLTNSRRRIMGKSSKGLIRVTSYMIVSDGMPDWDADGHPEWPQYEGPQQERRGPFAGRIHLRRGGPRCRLG